MDQSSRKWMGGSFFLNKMGHLSHFMSQQTKSTNKQKAQRRLVLDTSLWCDVWCDTKDQTKHLNLSDRSSCHRLSLVMLTESITGLWSASPVSKIINFYELIHLRLLYFSLEQLVKKKSNPRPSYCEATRPISAPHSPLMLFNLDF